MRIVTDWRTAWRWFSVQLLVVSAAVQGTMVAFPDELRDYLPDRLMHAIALALLGAAVLGRLINQKPHGDEPHA